MDNKIFKAKRASLYASVTQKIEAGIDPVYDTWANQLLKGRNANEVLGALLYICFDDQLKGKTKKRTEPVAPQHEDVRLFVGMGKKDGLTARALVSMVLDIMPIKAKKITNIHILETYAFMTMPANKADQLVQHYEAEPGAPLVTYENKGRGPKGNQGEKPEMDEQAPKPPKRESAPSPWPTKNE